MTAEYQRLQVNGIWMNVLIAGTGRDVLLVHGYPDDHRVWRNQVPALVAAGFRVIAPDTRGCGDSEISPGRRDYRVENLVQDLVALLDALGIERLAVVAHDWGAGICWQLAIRHPERVERYVALSTGHPSAYRRGGLEQKLKGYYTFLFQVPGLAEVVLRAGRWWGFRRITGYAEESSQWIARQSRPGRLRAGLNYYRANWRIFVAGTAAAARVPVMGTWSSGDRFLAERQMLDSANFVDGPFRYERIEGANHWLQLSGADRFNQLLLDYLKSDPMEGRP